MNVPYSAHARRIPPWAATKPRPPSGTPAPLPPREGDEDEDDDAKDTVTLRGRDAVLYSIPLPPVYSTPPPPRRVWRPPSSGPCSPRLSHRLSAALSSFVDSARTSPALVRGHLQRSLPLLRGGQRRDASDVSSPVAGTLRVNPPRRVLTEPPPVFERAASLACLPPRPPPPPLPRRPPPLGDRVVVGAGDVGDVLCECRARLGSALARVKTVRSVDVIVSDRLREELRGECLDCRWRRWQVRTSSTALLRASVPTGCLLLPGVVIRSDL